MICGECIDFNVIVEVLNVPVTVLVPAETLSAHRGENAHSKTRLHGLPTSRGAPLIVPDVAVSADRLVTRVMDMPLPSANGIYSHFIRRKSPQGL